VLDLPQLLRRGEDTTSARAKGVGIDPPQGLDYIRRLATGEEVALVRVLVNQLPTAGNKTGVGHYAGQLFRHLRRLAGPDQIDGYPGVCLLHARKVWLQVYPYLQGKTEDAPPDRRILPLPFPPLRRASLRAFRGIGRALMARHFRNVFNHRRYDLYHETNFLPPPNDFSTVT